MNKLIMVSVFFMSISSWAQISAPRNFGLCSIRYFYKISKDSSASVPVTQVRFKNDRFRHKDFKIENTGHTGYFEFHERGSHPQLTLSVNGKIQSIDAKDLFSASGKSRLSLALNTDQAVSVTCESMDLEAAFFNLMRAFDEKQ